MGIKSLIGFKFSAFIWLALLTACASAQPTIQRNGAEFILHKVEPGNTLYAISRLYQVPVTQLVTHNPKATSGIAPGDTIYVPLAALDKKELRKSDRQLQGGELIHVVQKKETLYSISKKYNLSVQALTERNPGVAQGLQPGQELVVPLPGTNVDERFLLPAENEVHEAKSVYTVSAGETWYTVSRLTGISEGELKQLNPKLANRALAAGDVLQVPEKNSLASDTLQPDTIQTSATTPTELRKAEGGRFNIALLMPFSLSENDSILANEMTSRSPKLPAVTHVAFDFYRGFKLALDSLEQRGLRCEVYIYDVGDDVVEARQVLKRPEFKTMHLIIGPMNKAPLAVVSEYSRVNGVPLVTPTGLAGSVTEENPYMINPYAGTKTQLEFLAEHAAENRLQSNLVLINSGNVKDDKLVTYFKGRYTALTDSTSPGLATWHRKDGSMETLSALLKTDRPNLLIVPSEQLAFISDFITRLTRIDKSKKIILYGMEGWLRYENIDASYKDRFSLRIAAPNFADVGENKTVAFLRAYRNRYRTEPNGYEFGYAGFDIGMTFGTALIETGPNFFERLTSYHFKGVYSNYKYRAEMQGRGLENSFVYLLEHRNLSLKPINE